MLPTTGRDHPTGATFAGAERARLECALFNRLSIGAAQLILVLSAVLPPRGVAFTVCWFRTISGLPCPGCGLTRSVTSLTQGHFYDALHHHPFGVIVWLLAMALASSPLWGEPLRQRLFSWLRRHDQLTWHCYLATVYSFVAFGSGRALLRSFEQFI